MHRSILFFVLLLVLATAPSLRADTIQLDGSTAGTFTFSGNGVTYELSPYGGLLNGQPASFICVDIAQTVPALGSWTATSTLLVNPAHDYSGTVQGSETVYLEMAWLATQMLNNLAGGSVGAATADQFAIWSFSGGPDPFATANPPFNTSSLDAQALAAVNAGFTVSGWQILTPDPGQAGQEMLMTPTPEPSSLPLLCAGLAGCLALGLWRRQ